MREERSELAARTFFGGASFFKQNSMSFWRGAGGASTPAASGEGLLSPSGDKATSRGGSGRGGALACNHHGWTLLRFILLGLQVVPNTPSSSEPQLAEEPPAGEGAGKVRRVWV